MKLLFRLLTPGTVLATGFLLLPGDSAAIQRYTDVTKKPCLYCHVSMMNKLKLTDAGKYFAQHHTFEGYQPPPAGKKG